MVGESWLLHLAGPALIAVAAIVAAALAAYTAGRNQRRQLEHDRELRDREHLRQVLDSTFDGSSEIVAAAVMLRIQAEDAAAKRDSFESTLADAGADEDDREAAAEGLVELRRKLHEATRNLRELRIEARRNSMRMRLRLGDHDILKAHNEFLSAVEGRTDILAPVVDRNLSEEELAADDAFREEAIEAVSLFSVACQRWFSPDTAAG